MALSGRVRDAGDLPRRSAQPRCPWPNSPTSKPISKSRPATIRSKWPIAWVGRWPFCGWAAGCRTPKDRTPRFCTVRPPGSASGLLAIERPAVPPPARGGRSRAKRPAQHCQHQRSKVVIRQTSSRLGDSHIHRPVVGKRSANAISVRLDRPSLRHTDRFVGRARVREPGRNVADAAALLVSRTDAARSASSGSARRFARRRGSRDASTPAAGQPTSQARRRSRPQAARIRRSATPSTRPARCRSSRSRPWAFRFRKESSRLGSRRALSVLGRPTNISGTAARSIRWWSTRIWKSRASRSKTPLSTTTRSMAAPWSSRAIAW